MKLLAWSIPSEPVTSSISFVPKGLNATRLTMVTRHRQSPCGLSNQERTTSCQSATYRFQRCMNGQSCDSITEDCQMVRLSEDGEQSKSNSSKKESSPKSKDIGYLVSLLTAKLVGDSAKVCTSSAIERTRSTPRH